MAWSGHRFGSERNAADCGLAATTSHDGAHGALARAPPGGQSGQPVTPMCSRPHLLLTQRSTSHPPRSRPSDRGPDRVAALAGGPAGTTELAQCSIALRPIRSTLRWRARLVRHSKPQLSIPVGAPRARAEAALGRALAQNPGASVHSECHGGALLGSSRVALGRLVDLECALAEGDGDRIATAIADSARRQRA